MLVNERNYMLYYPKSNRGGRRSAITVRVLPLLLLAMYLHAAAASKKLDVKGSAEAFGGYESNILRGDDNMKQPPSLGGRSFNPVKQDGTLGGAVKLRPTLTINKVHRVAVTLDGDYQLFPRYSEANQGQAEAGFDYRVRPIKPLTLKLLGNGGYTRKLGVDEGTEATKLYEYWQIHAGPRAEYSPSKSFTYKVFYQFSLLDYNDTDTARSLDNRQHEISAAFEPSFGQDYRSSICIEATYLNKNYLTLGSYNDSGAYFNRPLRTYHYVTIELTFKHDFGAVAIKAAYRPRYRTDAFADFYSYSEHRLSGGIAGKLPSNTSFSLDGSWRYRHYPVHTAAQPGNGQDPDLVMRYLDCSADIEQPMGKRFSLFAGYDLTVRRTNTGVLYFYTYRNYTDHEVKRG